MTKKELELPKINKKLSSFLLSEEGKISKKSLLRLSAALALVTIVSAGHVSAGCGCGASQPPRDPCAVGGSCSGGGCGGGSCAAGDGSCGGGEG